MFLHGPFSHKRASINGLISKFCFFILFILFCLFGFFSWREEKERL
jgi:hypothetical protein